MSDHSSENHASDQELSDQVNIEEEPFEEEILNEEVSEEIEEASSAVEIQQVNYHLMHLTIFLFD